MNFVPDIQTREQQLPIRKNEYTQPKTSGQLIRSASDCDSMNDFAEILRRHRPGNHLGQKGRVLKGRVLCYYA